MKLVIISGLSGSGKSVALRTLEDNGYYCADNLPANLLRHFVNELRHNSQNYPDYAAVGIDARANFESIQYFPKVLNELRSLDIDVEILFLSADKKVLLKRFSETRRKHPLSQFNRPLLEAIEYELDVLSSIRNLADFCIDSTERNANELKTLVQEQFSNTKDNNSKLSLVFQSFGFKYGLPSDTSFMFDVRCLPNPHWETHLRPLTGKDPAVAEYLAQQPEVIEMVNTISQFIETWLPKFEIENRRYMTISIGCTGGQHRSVYIAEQLKKYFMTQRNNVSLRHRQLVEK